MYSEQNYELQQEIEKMQFDYQDKQMSQRNDERVMIQEMSA